MSSDMRVVLIGRTGAGKSAVGNSLLDKKVFRSVTSAASVTTACRAGSRTLSNGTKLTVVDTPGMFDTQTSNKECCAEITRCFDLCSPRPHMFLLVLKVGRFTQEEIATVTILQELFGEDVVDYVIIVVSGKDSLTYEDVTLEEYLEDTSIPKELKELIIKCGNRVTTIDNRIRNGEREADVNAILHLVAIEIEEYGGECCYSKEMLEQTNIKQEYDADDADDENDDGSEDDDDDVSDHCNSDVDNDSDIGEDDDDNESDDIDGKEDDHSEDSDADDDNSNDDAGSDDENSNADAGSDDGNSNDDADSDDENNNDDDGSENENNNDDDGSENENSSDDDDDDDDDDDSDSDDT